MRLNSYRWIDILFGNIDYFYTVDMIYLLHGDFYIHQTQRDFFESSFQVLEYTTNEQIPFTFVTSGKSSKTKKKSQSKTVQRRRCWEVAFACSLSMQNFCLSFDAISLAWNVEGFGVLNASVLSFCSIPLLKNAWRRLFLMKKKLTLTFSRKIISTSCMAVTTWPQSALSFLLLFIGLAEVIILRQ